MAKLKKTLRAQTKDDILGPYILDHDFRSTKVNAAGEATNDIVLRLNVFDIQYQNNLDIGRTIKKEINFFEDVLAGIYGYALVLRNSLVGISSDGQRHFNLIYVKRFLTSFLSVNVFFVFFQ